MADLQSLYRDIILDHYRSPRRRGELASPPAHRSEGFNPLCGDEVLLTFEITDGAVSDLAVSGQGCSISQASASMMSEAVLGKSIDEVRELARRFKAMMGIETGSHGGAGGAGSPAAGADSAGTGGPATDGTGTDSPAADGADSLGGADSMGDLEAMRGVIKFPVRIKCATLAWNALLTGLDEALDKAAS